MNNTQYNIKEISELLSPEAADVQISTVKVTSSTNEQLKAQAKSGESEIKVLIAESQTKGKGTKGRSFHSPDCTGCYMSFFLRPKYSPEFSTLLTVAAATATAEAIEEVTESRANIKWVNDIIMNGRKVAGILTEAAIKKDLTGIEWAVVGIGINITEPKGSFPDEIKDIAGAISENADSNLKNRLCAEIINRFVGYYHSLESKDFFEQYKKRLFFLGHRITVIEFDKTYTATAVDIDEMCRLIVEVDGEQKVLNSGEISVRI